MPVKLDLIINRLVIMRFFLLISFVLSFSSYAGDRKSVDWKHCRYAVSGEKYTTIPFAKMNGEFVEECAPEVIYSWREDVSLEHMIQAEKNGKGIVASHPKKKLFTSKTPISSHGYGMTGVRIKLKDDVKFVYANSYGGGYDINRDCEFYKQKYPEIYDQLVIVAYLDFYNFSEYILCSDKPIHSWSYGTKEHLLEIEKEYEYFLKNPKPGNHEAVKMDIPVIGSEDCPDYKNCSEEKFKERLKKHQDMIKENKGKIFFSADVEKNNKDHFYTKKEFYYSLSDQQLKDFGYAKKTESIKVEEANK